MWEFLYDHLGFDLGVEPWDFAIIFALVFVEGALSADNAAVLAALTRTLPNDEERRRSLRYGIIGAFVFRFLQYCLQPGSSTTGRSSWPVPCT